MNAVRSCRSPMMIRKSFFFFFFNDTATTEIYTLSLHDALPIHRDHRARGTGEQSCDHQSAQRCRQRGGSEEHTSELQSRLHLVCRLLLEKKKNNNRLTFTNNNTKNHTNL